MRSDSAAAAGQVPQHRCCLRIPPAFLSMCMRPLAMGPSLDLDNTHVPCACQGDVLQEGESRACALRLCLNWTWALMLLT